MHFFVYFDYEPILLDMIAQITSHAVLGTDFNYAMCIYFYPEAKVLLATVEHPSKVLLATVDHPSKYLN